MSANLSYKIGWVKFWALLLLGCSGHYIYKLLTTAEEGSKMSVKTKISKVSKVSLNESIVSGCFIKYEKYVRKRY